MGTTHVPSFFVQSPSKSTDVSNFFTASRCKRSASFFALFSANTSFFDRGPRPPSTLTASRRFVTWRSSRFSVETGGRGTDSAGGPPLTQHVPLSSFVGESL